jgi:hypothetical protein
MKSRSLCVAVALVSIPAIVSAAPLCPPEVKEARDLLTAKTATAQKVPRSQAAARGQETQAPRQQVAQAPRGQETQAPRGQETQAPRGQETQAPRGQETQAPRGQETQAPRGQETQAPRGQETQAPRGQETQAPRGQETQAPRGQETQAPRGQETQAPRNAAKGRATTLTNARRLVNEAEAACKDADNARASSNARAAIELLRYLP